MSDPFQPVERIRKTSLKCLEIFAETQYPFIVSSKGKLLGNDEYLSLIKQCNGVVQISLVCESYDKLEQGCPPFVERLKIAEKAAKVAKRVIIRIQPYMCEVFKEVYANLERFADAGGYGVIVEGMKFLQKKPGLIKIGGDFCYPYNVIKRDIELLRERAHAVGLKFYVGENRLRSLGDSLTCCGVDGLEDFTPNKFNLNHILNGDKTVPTDAQQKLGTASCFKAIHQDSVSVNLLNSQSFAKAMMQEYKGKRKVIDEVLGVVKK